MWWILKRHVHVSWLIALFCFWFVIGVWSGQYVVISSWWLLAGLALVIMGFWRQRIYVLPIVAGGGLIIGACYGGVARGDLRTYQPLLNHQIELSGSIKEDPSRSAKGLLVVQVGNVKVGGHDLAGTIWVSLLGKPDIKRGDVVTVQGSLSEGFGTFAGALYTAKIVKIKRPNPGDVGRVVRDWFASAIRVSIPEPQASLGIGYLTGQKSALPSDLAQALQIAGLSHIVVASGYNLTILVRLARRLFVKVSKFLSMLSAAIMIGGFVAMTGLSPSMTRAGLVASLSLAAWYYGRQFHPFVLLTFAAAITVLWQPSYAWGDLGWQLSFAAFAAVMIVGPLMQRFFFGEKAPGTIRQVLGETVAAHIVTIPIVVPAFGLLSNVAIPANLLIVPLVPLAMLLTFVAGILGLLLPGVAMFVSQPATWLLTYMTETAEYLADLPWAQTSIVTPWWGIALYFAVLVGACAYMWRTTKFSLRSVNLIE